MSSRSITSTGRASSCYFRTTADGGARKALVQIDERCNLHCAHCFVSATKAGNSMPYDDIAGMVIPRLAACRVDRVTLTGGCFRTRRVRWGSCLISPGLDWPGNLLAGPTAWGTGKACVAG